VILIGLGSCAQQPFCVISGGSLDTMPVEMQQQQHVSTVGRGQLEAKEIQYGDVRTCHYKTTTSKKNGTVNNNNNGKSWKSRRGRRRNTKGDMLMVSDEQYATVRYDVNGQMCGYPFAYHVPVDGYQGGRPSDPTAIYFTPTSTNHQSFVPYYGWDSMYGQPPRQHQFMYQSSSARVKNDVELVGAGGHQENEQKKKNRNMQTQSLGECAVAPVSTLGSLWTSSALPAIEDKKDDAPDLERFLRAATPRFRLSTDPSSLKDFKLMDVWKHFERISAYGMRCSTLGGPRGASSSYFVPFLSSIQLFEPADGSEPDALSYPEGLEAWPRHMRQTFSWSAKNHVGERLPLSQQIMELVGNEKSTHVLAASKISELHPYSWFAVAWYPLYRIPEAPLTARFLTFHSIAPLWEAAMQSIADRRTISALHSDASNCLKNSDSSSVTGIRKSCSSSTTAKGVASFPGSSRASSESSGSQKAAALVGTTTSSNNNPNTSDIASVSASHGSSGPPTSAPLSVAEDEEELEKAASCTATTISSTASLSKIELAPVGLCWHTTAGNSSSRRRMPSENWTDTMVKVDASEHTHLSQGDSLPGSTNACVVSVSSGYVVVKKNYPLSKGGPLSWDIQQEELAEGARRLALGLGIHKQQNTAAESLNEDICPDYQFFVSRHSQ